jgi:toxin secretion/phage lysis holin
MTDFLNYLHIRLSGIDFLRLIGAGIAAAITYVFGGADSWLVGLAVLVIADYISGVIAAYINNELNSRRGFAGILKKILLFCVVAVATIIDNATGASGVLRSAAIGFLMANEGISVLENSARCGVRLPQRLIRALEQLRGEDVETIGNENKPPSEDEDGDPDEPYDGDGSGD